MSMVSTIGSMVHGAKTARSAWIAAGAHVLGGILGGLLVGLVAGAAGRGLILLVSPFPGARRIVLGAVLAGSLLVFAVDLCRRGGGFGLHRQTPRSWRILLPDAWAAFLYGADLGLGWSTRLYFASYFVAIGAAFLLAEPLGGVMVGALFGGARAATAVLVMMVTWRRLLAGSRSILAERWSLIKAVDIVVLGQFVLVLGFTLAQSLR
jgi:hypothetical protein